MATSPAFQFYPNDWLSSPNIMLMTPAEEGAYIRLLAIAWNSQDCGLPDDDAILSQLSRLGEGWFGVSSQRIKKNFIQREGKLFNERLLKERKKQSDWLKKSSNAGKKSWEVRKKTGKMTGKGWAKVGSEMVQTKTEPKPNSSSSFSSSNKKEIIKKAESLLEIYPGNGNRTNALKSILKLFSNPPDELLPCPYASLKNRVERYCYEIKVKKTDKQYFITSHNFFGKAERWKDERPEEKKTVW
jgi:uncharacterized protein YdaU (DUF1376 family)